MPVPTAPDPVPASRLRREEVEQRLRIAIVHGELRPGERLTEDDLAAWLGVSRTPIREALSRLAVLGLVEVDANRGARVAPLDPDEMIDLVQVSRALVLLVRQLVAERATDEELAALRAMLQRRRSHAAAGDHAAAEDDLFEYHERLLALARNRELTRIYPSVALRLERLVRIAYNGEVGTLGTDADTALLALFAERDVDGVRDRSLSDWHDLEVGVEMLAERLRAGLAAPRREPGPPRP